MKINGHKIQQRLREFKAELDVVYAQAEDALKMFEGENKGNPIELSNKIFEIEQKIVDLQLIQSRYNLNIEGTVKFDKERNITLAEAIKIVGPCGRLEKFWRKNSTPNKKDSYYREESRSKDELYAERTVSYDAALEKAKYYGRIASAVRQFIAEANTKELEFENLERLFSE